MVRLGISGIGGFILIFLEVYIVMFLKGYQSIEFGGISPFISVWAMNFFLLFSILTQIMNWYDQRSTAKVESSIKE
ncbi:hypothetical protein [Cytobacillus dafuensis]|uniref:Uncharacterized protein n=1 Tax=Cytobacillus dafuensis TaxID=1742359 RepID=A0A5B8Z5K4_CYTDA|nr:hypothetical protein [Cytobacillus dafuensis]QED48241.1 hypothetical protein FSZ17_13880 [Cytobacillus dafuensis]